MSNNNIHVQDVVIKFAGDSGDGMQLTGSQFTNNTALMGIDLSTFPDFPAEIRAPQGTLPGVSGFQLHFSSNKVYTPGDACDVLVAMNAAALKVNLKSLKKGGIIIANTDGFDSKNLRLANYPDDAQPLDDESLSNFIVYKIDVTKLTREALASSTLGTKERDRAKNMFVLGFLYWMYNRDMETTLNFITEKFGKKPEILESNILALKAGYNYADTTETFTNRYSVDKAKLTPGVYRSITGNIALSYGLIAASEQSGLSLFLGSYPITPASDILHELSRHKQFGVVTVQAEDEIAAISSAIGASYGGSLAITTTSGPGMALKTEAMGLAVMLEIPLIIINIQRGGPSTGLPTKTEQSDLLQAYYGRNGECPMPVISCSSPADCFDVAMEACRISLQHVTPIILLSDGYIANGSEPWRFPQKAQLPSIQINYAQAADAATYQPYERNEMLARTMALPGTPGLEHRIGGLEKQDVTGNVSYDPDNHQHMVLTREAKVDAISNYIPELSLSSGALGGKVLVLGWGSTYGVIQSVVNNYIDKGHAIAHAHLRYIKPFQKNLESILKSFDVILMPEINNGQLDRIIKAEFGINNIHSYHKIKGSPIDIEELQNWVAQYL
jgi:2-oxoglutarate/2-oxoacid ferredoxin oxidoreductase subunit alpha